jgi:hypothetical protein
MKSVARLLLKAISMTVNGILRKLKSFDLELLQFAGFDEKELVKFWDEEKDTKDDKFDVDKELKKIKTPQTKFGDLIIMGNHKLLCSSSTDITRLKNYSVMIELLLSTVIHLLISGFHMTKAWAINPTTEVRLTTINHQKHTKNLFAKFLNHHLQYPLKILTCAFWCDEAWVWVFKLSIWN